MYRIHVDDMAACNDPVSNTHGTSSDKSDGIGCFSFLEECLIFLEVEFFCLLKDVVENLWVQLW